MKRSFYTLLTLAVICGAFCACKKTVTLPLKSLISLSMVADSTSFDVPVTPKVTPAPNITFTSGGMLVNTFKFVATKSGSPIEKVIMGNDVTDLFAKTPVLYTINVDTGAYVNSEFRVRFLKTTVANAPAPLILKGTYKTATATTPIEVDFNETTEVRIKIKDQVIVDGLTDITSYLKIYLNRLFMGVMATDVDKAVRTNNVILINSTTNRNIYLKIRANILNAVGGDATQVSVED
ncbi:hypothetical protein [Mucilaginibacter ginkgonis]|uniref:Uncharacterized protein n=1 Tax=Mucilaginibacter ginkgonis TaxID=2682091 RepID=A0A6I4I0F1_9SPHI|nr:hypothetical protein [Mucilaginibacter ginkgonis]QQL48939.1 hypothetical protein GO620_012215 [Mucilaginibacter ginkgonis]